VETQKTLRSKPFSFIGYIEVPPYILHVTFFFFIEILVLTVFSGKLWGASMAIKNTAPEQTTDLIMAMHSSVQDRLFAKFAGHTVSEAGKLSLKERDVSFFRIFDVC